MALYKYQEDYIRGMPKNIIMTADVGLGKGQMSLEHYKRHSLGNPLLIIAPASKVRTGDWDREVEMAFKGEKLPDYQVVSYDMFGRAPLRFAPEPTMPATKLTIIADECHYICNSQAKRSKAVVKAFRDWGHQFIGLSATPLPNGWSSLENYAILFGLSRNKTDFISQFVRIDRTRGFPIIMGYNQVPLLEKFWLGVSKPLRRDGVADLPESHSIGRGVFMHPRDIGEYQRMVKERITADGEILDSPSKLFATLRQWITPHREDELVNLIEGTDEHIIVFYNYDVERELIHKVLKKHFPDRKVYEQSGHASELPERGEWETMKPSVTIAQYQSASTAIELTYASVTIYLSPTYSYAQFHQSMGRTRRNGQEKKTLFYMISVQNTLDSAVYKALKGKQDFNINLMEKYIDNFEAGMYHEK